MQRAILGITILTLAGCASGPRPQAAEAGPPPVRAPSVYALLGERERLELTSDQVEALDSIGQWLSAETDALRGEADGATRTRASRDSASAAAAADAVTALHLHAIDGVRALLTDEQREKVCTLQREARDEGAPGRAAARGNARDVRMPPSRARWTWCPEEVATPANP